MGVAAFFGEMDQVGTKLIAPAGYIEFYGDPFHNLGGATENNKWKGKGKLVATEAETETETEKQPGPEPCSAAVTTTDDQVDWTRYEPPEALKAIPENTDEVLLEVVESSIESTRARIVEEQEERRRSEEEESRRQKETDANRPQEWEGDRETNKEEPYLPIIIPPEHEEPAPEIKIEPARAPTWEQLDPRMAASLLGNGEGSSTGREFDAFQRNKRRRKHHRLFNLSHLLGKFGDREHVRTALVADLCMDSNESSSGIPAQVSRHNQEVALVSRMKTVAEPRSMPQPRFESLVESQPEPEPEPEPIQEVECVSCLDDFLTTDVIKAPCHSYCPDCFTRLISSSCQHEQHWPPKCCLNEIPQSTIRAHAPSSVLATFASRSAEWSIPVPNRIYCHQPTCGLFVGPSQTNRATRVATCTAGHRTCALCRGALHAGVECPSDRDLALTEALADEEGWVRCGRCRALVEHREACQHMTCRCGHEFCYVCGVVWQTCRCTMEQLRIKKEEVATRRADREAREAREEGEVREALRLVEEFEREEARKAELLRLEAERREAEVRVGELEARIAGEEERRRGVVERFAGLRGALVELNASQGSELARCQGEEEKGRMDGEEEARAAMRAEHEAERGLSAARVVGVLAAKEKAFRLEYAARVAQEREVEEGYLRMLSEFYGEQLREGSPAEERVDEAMAVLRKKMDKGWRAWMRWRDGELAKYRVKIEDERAIKDELMDRAALRLKESSEAKADEDNRRQRAEAKWVEVMVAERERVLDEIEIRELEAGLTLETLLWELEEATAIVEAVEG